MSEPHPSGQPSDHPDDADHDNPTRPATGFPEPPGQDPGDVSRASSPYAPLNTPVGEPDPTEWPDPYDRRDDPRAPAEEMVFPGDGRTHTPTGATTTSAPHPDDDIAVPNANAPERDALDD